MLQIIIISLALVWTTNGMAGGLVTPNSIGTTTVLPKGIRSVSVSGLATTIDGWYNDYGVTTGVAEPFNQKLSYERLLKAESSENLKLNVQSQLELKGVDLNSIAGESFADINTRVVATVPAIAYGVTNRLTLAVAVPIVYTNMDVATGFVGSEELQTLVNDFSKDSRKQTKLIQQKLQDVIATELANKGYKPLQDEEATRVGDIMLVAKYLLAKNLYYSWALTNIFTLPTSPVRDVARLVDPTPGDGQFDYGIASTLEVPINGQWKVFNQTGYTIQFGDVRATRVPITASERASADIDPGAWRDLGDQMYTSFATTYSPIDLITFGGSYTIAYKQRDRWSGSLYSGDRYELLGIETEQFMQAAYLQTSFSTVSAYRNKKFPIPLMATLGAGKVIDGRNVRHDPLFSLNMTVFF